MDEPVIKTASFTRAHKFLHDAIDRNGFVAVIGDKGIGKTFIKTKIIGAFSEKKSAFKVADLTALEEREKKIGQIMSAMIQDVGGENPRMDKEARRRQLRRILGTCTSKVILVIDEAQDLHKSTIRGLKKLHELNFGTRSKLFSIVLFAQPTFTDMISDDELRPRIRRMKMNPLTVKEKELFVPKKNFTEKAYKMFIGNTSNLPAVIINLYDELYDLAEGLGSKITEELVSNFLFYETRERFKQLNKSYRKSSAEIKELLGINLAASTINAYVTGTYTGNNQEVEAILNKYIAIMEKKKS